MNITLVMDQYGLLNNGTTATARYLAEKLKEHGHNLRIVTCIANTGEDNVHVVQERTYPLITSIIHSHGMVLAKPDKKVLTEAIAGSDIVHFFLPFKLAATGKKIADKLGVAASAAFHLQPENITYNLKLNKFKFLHTWLYRHYKKFFDKFPHIHVPSRMIDYILAEYEYCSSRHVISNGVNEAFKKIDSQRPAELEGKYLIVMAGRLATEKRQDLLIDAVSKSAYADKIQLILCGRGPTQSKLEKQSNELLKNKAIIKFCNREELIQTFNYCDLYVHTSEVELEAISCMEAFTCGLVPIISDAEMSATKQFALHEQNIFKAGNSDDLRQKIDWFIENEDKKKQMEAEYLNFAENFKIDKCVTDLENVFLQIIKDNEVKKANIKSEKEYLSSLSFVKKRKYKKDKRLYQETQVQMGTPDYLESYINEVKSKK